MSYLRIRQMSHTFGGLRAVHNYNLEIGLGEIRGLIGPNGAGKTTIFNLITGIHTPSEGEILLDGRQINGLQPYQIASMGVSRTFQNLLLWRHMTVLEHVKMAEYSKINYGLLGAFFGTPKRQACAAAPLMLANGKLHQSWHLAFPRCACLYRAALDSEAVEFCDCGAVRNRSTMKQSSM